MTTDEMNIVKKYRKVFHTKLPTNDELKDPEIISNLQKSIQNEEKQAMEIERKIVEKATLNKLKNKIKYSFVLKFYKYSARFFFLLIFVSMGIFMLPVLINYQTIKGSIFNQYISYLAVLLIFYGYYYLIFNYKMKQFIEKVYIDLIVTQRYLIVINFLYFIVNIVLIIMFKSKIG